MFCSHTDVSLSPPLPFSLKINKILKHIFINSRFQRSPGIKQNKIKQNNHPRESLGKLTGRHIIKINNFLLIQHPLSSSLGQTPTCRLFLYCVGAGQAENIFRHFTALLAHILDPIRLYIDLRDTISSSYCHIPALFLQCSGSQSS